MLHYTRLERLNRDKTLLLLLLAPFVSYKKQSDVNTFQVNWSLRKLFSKLQFSIFATKDSIYKNIFSWSMCRELASTMSLPLPLVLCVFPEMPFPRNGISPKCLFPERTYKAGFHRTCFRWKLRLFTSYIRSPNELNIS